MVDLKKCEWCGAFLPAPKKAGGRQRQFCDPKTTGRWCQKASKRAGGVKPDRRYCRCGKDIPKGARSDAKYCSTQCKNEARWSREKKARTATKKVTS